MGELGIRVLGVVDDLGGLLFGLCDLGFLVDDLFVELLEEQGQLGHGLFDALDIVVAGANGAEHGGGLAGAVRFELLKLLVICSMVTASELDVLLV